MPNTPESYLKNPSAFHGALQRRRTAKYITDLWNLLGEYFPKSLTRGEVRGGSLFTSLGGVEVLQMALLAMEDRQLSFPRKEDRTTVVKLLPGTNPVSTPEVRACKKVYLAAVEAALAAGEMKVLVPFAAPKPPFAVHVLALAELMLEEGLHITLIPEGIDIRWRHLRPPLNMTFLTDYLRANPLPLEGEPAGA